jgi:predicted phosphodiesterase
MYFQECGYDTLSVKKIDVTTSAGDGTTLYASVRLHNTGTETVYIKGESDVDGNDWEIAAGEKEGPFYFQKLYCITTSGTSTIKVLLLKGV